MNWETGVGIAFLMWLWNSVMVILHANSRLDANLRKIGLRISWLTFAPKELSPKARDRPFWKNALKYALFVGLGLPLVLLSWLYVAMSVGMLIWSWSKNQGAPQTVREYRWKMRNVDMDLDDLVRESMKAKGTPPEDFERAKADTLTHLQERGLT